MKKLRWGVLSTARIGTHRVVPAMQAGTYCEVTAIASRSLEKAQVAAKELGLGKAFGSYEELLADPDLDAVYISLPNQLHVPWSIRALRAGKHVLCEKPIAMNAAEAVELLKEAQQHPRLRVMEAFMYRHHPQWELARRLLREGQIGDLRAMGTWFSFHNLDPNDIRNQPEMGGGGMLDIGCYCISGSRMMFGAEPRRVVARVENDPSFQVDRLASAILEFDAGTATFTCGTQLAPFQKVILVGSQGRLELDTPFSLAPGVGTQIWHRRGAEIRELPIEPHDHYTIQGDSFSKAVIENKEVPFPLTDAVSNMRVIDAVLRSGNEDSWVSL